MTNPSQNMSNLPVETLEARYPLLMEEYALRPDSGGAGQYRGGLGLVRQYRLLADTRGPAAARRPARARRPMGCSAAGPGRRSRNLIDRGARLGALPGKVTLEIERGHGHPPRAGRRRRLGRPGAARPGGDAPRISRDGKITAGAGCGGLWS